MSTEVARRGRRIHCGAIALLFLVGSPTSGRGDEPVLAELLQRLPPLSSVDGELKSFSCRSRIVLPTGGPLELVVAWADEKNYSMLVASGDEARTPLTFCAEQRTLLFDLAAPRLVVREPCMPQVHVGLNEDRSNFSLDIGVKTKSTTKIVIDPGAFLTDLGDEGRWEQTPAATWRYANVSKSGSTRITAEFDPARKYPLLKVELANDGQTFLTVEEITVNEPLPDRLCKFPKFEPLPDGLALETFRREGDASFLEGLSEVKQFMSILFTAAAVDNPELRELVGDFDWDRVKENRRRYGPAVRKLLEPSTP